MANTRSAIKRIRSSARRRQRNLLVRSRMRSAVKQAYHDLQGGGSNAAATVALAISQLDRGVSKGVLHRNSAARRKARLMKRLNRQA